MINQEDPQPNPPPGGRWLRHPLIGRLARFFTWWLIFTGIYASSSVCPFCGRAGCPVGGVSAGVVGGIFALVLETGKAWLTGLSGLGSRLRTKFSRGLKP
jgi:hypothetical protein